MEQPAAPSARKRILFVDDDPNVLQGLRRLLRSHREQWDMSFAGSGREALELIKTQGCDIVVSDMRMPEMSGAELLTEVQRIAPHSVRMILSGHAEVSAIVQSVGPSHQFLAKPCDPAVLASYIQRAFALREAIHDPRILELVGGMKTLPSIPSVYQEVVAAIRAERPLSEIGALVTRDMGMTTKLLQLVNSSYFGVARKIDNPAQAVLLIGIETLQSLVLGAKIFEELPAKDEEAMQIVWQESNRAVGFARKLCAQEKLDTVATSQALVASFLHDVGLVALASRRPDLFSAVWPEAGTDPLTTDERERAAIGASHGQIGGALLGLWNLPDPIVEAVTFHHRPGLCPGGAVGETAPPLAIVHVAASLSRVLPESDDPAELQKSGIDMEYLGRVGVLPRVPKWVATCRALMEND